MAIPNGVCTYADESTCSVLQSPKLAQARAVRKLSDALDEQLRAFFLYGAIKGETLVFFFSHPGALTLFSYRKEAILARMRTIYKQEKMKPSEILFRRIDARYKPTEPIDRDEISPNVSEKSNGTFEIKCNDPTLAKAFRNIREHIRRHRGKTA